MATNLQVNASTQAAASAFSALAASIGRAHSAFQNLMAATSAATGTNSRYANSVTAINTAFGRLSSMLSNLTGLITRIGAGIQLVFSSMLRELDKIQGFQAIMSVTAKSTEVASQSFEFLRRTADRLGVQFDAISANYAKLVAAIPAGTDALRIAEKVFLGVAMAARTLHSTNQDTQLMFYAVTQIASKGIVSMEELRRQLGEKLPGVIQIAAAALNTIPEKLEAAIRKGIVSSEKFLPIFGDALIRTFADSSERAAQSVSASINRLTNVWVDFVKEVLDSGAGDAIVRMFDALRDKLSDPYLIDRFAQLIKYLAERMTDFIKQLTTDDLRTGFDQFQKGLGMIVDLLGKVIDLISWIINNSGKAGAIIGGLAGLSVGAITGPVGAAVGLVGGAAGGAYLGSQLSATPAEQALRNQQDATARANAQARKQADELFKMTQLVPTLQQFRGLNTLNGLERLFQAENLNTKTIQDLNTILTSKDFKDDRQRAQGVRDYARYGTVMTPTTATLESVTTQNTKSNARDIAAANAAYARAVGLTSTYYKELDALNKLFRSGRLDFAGYEEGMQRLIQKQPYMIEYQRQLKEEQREANKAITQYIDSIVEKVMLDERVQGQMAAELRLAGLRQDDLRIEADLMRLVAEYTDKYYTVKQSQIDQWREELRLRERLRELTSAESNILAATVDRYRPAIINQQAMQRLISDPSSGFTQQDAQDYTINSDPNFVGSQQWLEAQKRSLQDYYAFIEGLRRQDLISEQSAQQAKALAQLQYDQLRIQYAQNFFGNLASLSDSKSKTLARIGKAAAITQATIDAYLAINKALATIPPPASYFVVASIGAMAFANVSKIAGFKKGGYTGDYGTDEVAGVVHGREYVVNAVATARNRAVLEAINSGREVQVGGITVEYHNHGTPKSVQVEQISDQRIRIIARDEATKTAPTAVARSIADPNSDVSRALNTYTNSSRRR